MAPGPSTASVASLHHLPDGTLGKGVLWGMKQRPALEVGKPTKPPAKAGAAEGSGVPARRVSAAGGVDPRRSLLAVGGGGMAQGSRGGSVDSGGWPERASSAGARCSGVAYATTGGPSTPTEACFGEGKARYIFDQFRLR